MKENRLMWNRSDTGASDIAGQLAFWRLHLRGYDRSVPCFRVVSVIASYKSLICKSS